VTLKGHFGGYLLFVTSCAQLTRDLLAIAKFLVSLYYAYETVTLWHYCCRVYTVIGILSWQVNCYVVQRGEAWFWPLYQL